jgi:hypothetical protein
MECMSTCAALSVAVVDQRFTHKLQDNVLSMLWTKNPSFEAYGQKQEARDSVAG